MTDRANRGRENSDRANRGHENRGFRRLFGDDDLSVGLFFPITTAEDDVPPMDDQMELARDAEELGFDALWVRDVPTYWPKFGDAGQVYDPWVYLGQVAARTDDVALGTGSVVLPLRHPLHVAKSAASVDRLSDGRLVLGIATGDRSPEYSAFGVEEAARGERFREHVRVLRTVWAEEFPEVESAYGTLDGNLNVVPKPTTETLPLLVTGNSRQSLDWIADNGDGWLHYQMPLKTVESVVGDWREAAGDKPFAQATTVNLKADPEAGMEHVHQGFAAGSEWFVEHFRALADRGVDHLAIGIRGSDRDARTVLAQFADEVLDEL
ncbi:LLM class oxidoreductase [Halorussus sp. MSC15.2]|uniref:LLM class oxidoreductase n=1 Tax=Halorussus sp. MSC15.2 TaxID=2283638 RepID=UPI0013D6063A|nr:LLM class oxidoreductase [Halorussus sp. MSC15.2]NEU58284.1 LLM class oxidoreductase [Halorussus sp. MSC15.2]